MTSGHRIKAATKRQKATKKTTVERMLAARGISAMVQASSRLMPYGSDFPDREGHHDDDPEQQRMDLQSVGDRRNDRHEDVAWPGQGP